MGQLVARTDKMKFTLLSLFLVTITLASVSAKFNWFIASQEEDCSNIKKTSGNHEKDHGPMKSCKEDNENICFCANKGGDWEDVGATCKAQDPFTLRVAKSPCEDGSQPKCGAKYDSAVPPSVQMARLLTKKVSPVTME